MKPYPFADLPLSRRLERAEATGNRRFVEERAHMSPERGACWIDVAGTYAMFDGVSSPITQTFGLGMFSTPTPDDLRSLESFFFERGAPAHHEVSPQADPATLALLNARGYQPMEFTSVMFRPIEVGAPPSVQPAVSVRMIGADEADVWARTAAEGWRELGPADFMLDVAHINANAPDGHLFLAELDGRPIATGVLAIHDGVAHLAGASTIPSGRQQGAQLALLDARLRHAAEQGCDLALMGAAPGSGSQRNAERHGFRIAYTRIKWRLTTKT
jgi:GNAT superfamily N-acetyltransferase